MKREEHKQNLISIDDKIYGNCRNTAMEAIDRICDDFESRTCESCKWYREEYNDKNCISDTVLICELYDISHGKDFGCNKWEKKDY